MNPKIMIFDDDPQWAKQMRLLLTAFHVTAISDPKDWDVHISRSDLQALVVDVDILGDKMTGPERAMKSILEFGVTAPAVIISGVVDLDEVKKKYGDLFYGYVHKDRCPEDLPGMLKDACTPESRLAYIRRMTAEMARQRGVLDYEFPPDWIEDDVIRGTCSGRDRLTIGGFIDSAFGGTNAQLSRMGQSILGVISRASG